MLDQTDLYTCEELYELEDGVTFGSLRCNYSVRKYVDVKNLTTVNAYVVTCTQRIAIPNATLYSLQGEKHASFTDYPALVSLSAAIVSGSAKTIVTSRLRNYSPKTLNTSVDADTTQGSTNSAGVARQHTSGSVASTTNSYDWSVGLGAGSYGRSASNTHETSQSKSTIDSTGNESQWSDSDSMTIKDWGGYTQLDASYAVPSWVWGQEYPWNTMQFKVVDGNGHVILPEYVQKRLYDGTLVYPPSQLSQFGVDFVCKASWLVELDGDDPVIQFTHAVNYATATHSVESGKVVATINNAASLPVSLSSTPIDLEQLALDPILKPHAGNGAVIGFVADKFRVSPQPGHAFSIASRSNNLLVRGAGFQNAMTADLSKGNASLQVYCKIVDASKAYRLVLKHWKSGAGVVQLTFRFSNGTTVTKFVDATEGEGGESNVLTIDLRNNNFASINYHDYLVYGLNRITVDIAPVAGSAAPCQYTLQALAIG